MQNVNQELLEFISRSPSVFHAVAAMRAALESDGYQYLREASAWEILPGGKYYSVRNDSSIIAFHVGTDLTEYSFRIAASHSDAPVYKIKAVPELSGPDEYLRLNVEAYGGVIDASWFDRPLGVAGRVFVRSNGRIETRLFYPDKDLLIIPNVAIHFNREVNSGYAYNRQVDLCPLFSAGALKAGDFDAMIASELNVPVEDIVSRDLFLVNRQKGRIWGWKDEFISSPKLDDLQCAFSMLQGFLKAEEPHGINVFCCFDNEEVGSNTRQGAMSTFLKDCLTRLNACLGFPDEQYRRAVAASFMLSADNAHAVHPNHPEKTDAANKCFLNKGIVLKENASQKYTTDALSRAVVMEVCRRAGEPCQVFANRSDAAGGSTLGNISNVQVSLHAADIGLPQLAMHSSYETAGAKDTESAISVFAEYYRAKITLSEAEFLQIS